MKCILTLPVIQYIPCLSMTTEFDGPATTLTALTMSFGPENCIHKCKSLEKQNNERAEINYSIPVYQKHNQQVTEPTAVTYVWNNFWDQHVLLVAQTQTAVSVIAPHVDEPDQSMSGRSYLKSYQRWVEEHTPVHLVRCCAADRRQSLRSFCCLDL